MKNKEQPKPRINPNDNRFTTKVVGNKKKQDSKDKCKKYKHEK